MQVLKNNMQFYFYCYPFFPKSRTNVLGIIVIENHKTSFLVQTEEYLNETINLN